MCVHSHRIGLIWFTDGSWTAEGTGAGVCGQSVGRRLSISVGKHATVFQAEVYVILVCIHENETQDRPENCVSICSDSQVALKALQTAKTTSPFVRQCQKALNDISTRHTMGLYWVRGHAGYKEMKLPTSLEETVLLKGLLDLSLPWGSLGRT
jgi:ribonuclease HI